MAISIKFGTFTGEKEELGKSVTWLNDGTAIDCQLVNTSLTDPVLKMLGGKVNFNYIEIVQFGRKYFVESTESTTGGHSLLHCHVDVLDSFETGIRNLECLILRNEDINKWKRDMTDSAIPVSNRRVVYGRNFGDSIVRDTEEYILGMIGDIL